MISIRINLRYRLEGCINFPKGVHLKILIDGRAQAQGNIQQMDSHHSPHHNR